MSISITIAGSEAPDVRQVDTATTGLDLFGDDPSIVAMKVNGETKDLAADLDEGDQVAPVLNTSEEGLSILRHSCAHVAAQAVQQLYAEAKLGIGPPINDGFYYDFRLDEPFTPDSLKAIEKKMVGIIKEKQRFVRRVVTDEQANTELAAEPFKLELVNLKGSASDEDGSSVEVAAGELTIYDNVRRGGERAWGDLCRGPHVPHTGYINQAGFALMRTSAAYWRGDQANPQLQRLYGTAWPTKDALKEYLHRLEEAAKRDHRKLGAELDLYSFPEEIGPGLVVMHPKGGVIKRVMEDYVRRRHIEEGFEYVSTPEICKEEVFHLSGHLPYYADTMYPPMDLDGQKYYLKAMNCPMHNLIYRSRGRSYRDLPLRLFEFGHVYRNEKSGVVQGLTRVRGMTQDDSHTYCTPEQADAEIKKLLHFVLGLLRDFGLNEFYLELSTKDEKNADKFVGSDDQWEAATQILADACADTGLDLVDDPGGAAFYGPKVSVQAKDAIGRTWQLSTIQYDFNQPQGFDLHYTATDGSHQQPIMLHSAKFGSIERFLGVMVEHYAGAFPPWLAPVQVIGIPVAAEFSDYLQQVAETMRAAGVRMEVDVSDDRMQKKIRNAQKQKVPWMLIAGGEDRDANAVSFRYRDGRQNNGVPIEQALAEIASAINARAQV